MQRGVGGRVKRGTHQQDAHSLTDWEEILWGKNNANTMKRFCPQDDRNAACQRKISLCAQMVTDHHQLPAKTTMPVSVLTGGSRPSGAEGSGVPQHGCGAVVADGGFEEGFHFAHEDRDASSGFAGYLPAHIH